MPEPWATEGCLQAVAAERDEAIAERDRTLKYLREMGEALRIGFDFEATARARDDAIAERDEAIAERDFILEFLRELGEAFSQSRRLSFRPRRDGGVEIRSHYPSPAAALKVSLEISRLRAMVAMTRSPVPERAFAAYQAKIAAQPRA